MGFRKARNGCGERFGGVGIGGGKSTKVPGGGARATTAPRNGRMAKADIILSETSSALLLDPTVPTYQ